MAAMAESGNEEKRRKDGKPQPDIAQVHTIASTSWKLHIVEAGIKQLESYDDANFYLRAMGTKSNTTDEAEFLLKFYNAVESNNTETLKGISLLLKTVTSYTTDNLACGYLHPTVPVPIKTDGDVISSDGHGGLDDAAFFQICSASDNTNIQNIAARLFHWVPGPTLNKAGAMMNPNLIVNLGFSLGSITNSLRNFDHPSFHREHAWDLQNFESTCSTFSKYIEEQDVKDLVAIVYQRFIESVMPVSGTFSRSILMGDCNDANVIVNEEMAAVTGIIDFGDAVYTWSVNEIAIAMAYALLTTYGKEEPLKCIACLFGGYTYATHQSGLLTAYEIENLHTLISMRLCTSIMIGAYSISKDPTNEYLKLHSHPSKESLRALTAGGATSLSSGNLSDMFSRIVQVDLASVADSTELVALFVNIAEVCRK